LLPFEQDFLPLHGSQKWEVEWTLRASADVCVAGGTSGATQPAYRYDIPEVELYRVISDERDRAFNSALNGDGVSMKMLYWTQQEFGLSAAAFPNLQRSVGQRVDGEVLIMRNNAAISGSSAKKNLSFVWEHNGLTSVYVQYPSGNRWPSAGEFDVTEATGTYEPWQAMEDCKKDLEMFYDGYVDPAGMGVGPSINGLIANADNDFQVWMRPQSREQGVANWVLSGTCAAASKAYVFTFTKATLNIKRSSHELVVF